MPLSNAVLREHADALNTLFNAQQSALIVNLVNAALDEADANLAALEDRVEVLEAAP
jgi:hypothetical protein